MTLTPEQRALGRRNFLKAVAGVPALAGLGVAAATHGPVRGGPVRVGFIGLGGEGRVLLAQTDPMYAEVRALCDINPEQLAKADEVLAKTKRPAAKHYAEWRDMVAGEPLEAVIIAVPLWMHAEITCGCLESGLHVLCEKMMAWDVAGCERMRQTARSQGKLLEIGYQRYYNPIYQAAYAGVVQAGGARRREIRPARVASQWELAPRGETAIARLRPLEMGVPDLRASAELAPVQTVLARAARGAGQPSGQRRQLVLRRHAAGGASAPAASSASPMAHARCTTTCTPPSSTRAAARPRSRRSSRTPSITSTRRSSAPRPRSCSGASRRPISSTKARRAAQPTTVSATAAAPDAPVLEASESRTADAAGRSGSATAETA